MSTDRTRPVEASPDKRPPGSSHDRDCDGRAGAATVRDHVCGMSVDPHTAKHTAPHAGRPYYFCSARCRERFIADPQKFLAPQEARAEKLKVLRAISLPADITTGSVRGQYLPGWVAGERAVGYLEEPNIPADSVTETYAAVRLGIDSRDGIGDDYCR